MRGIVLANGYMTSGIDTNAQPIPLIIEEQWRCIYCSVVITMRHKQRKEIVDKMQDASQKDYVTLKFKLDEKDKEIEDFESGGDFRDIIL